MLVFLSQFVMLALVSMRFGQSPGRTGQKRFGTCPSAQIVRDAFSAYIKTESGSATTDQTWTTRGAATLRDTKNFCVYAQSLPRRRRPLRHRPRHLHRPRLPLPLRHRPARRRPRRPIRIFHHRLLASRPLDPNHPVRRHRRHRRHRPCPARRHRCRVRHPPLHRRPLHLPAHHRPPHRPARHHPRRRPTRPASRRSLRPRPRRQRAHWRVWTTTSKPASIAFTFTTKTQSMIPRISHHKTTTFSSLTGA